MVLGGSSGIGLETARRARDEGADLILTARDPDRLLQVGLELGASISAFDLSDADRLLRFFANLPGPIHHLLVSGPGPTYVPFVELDTGTIRHGVERIMLSVQIAHAAKDVLQPAGSLLLVGCTSGRRLSAGPLISAVTAAMPALARSLAFELAPIRVNVIAPGFVDTRPPVSLLGDGRGEQLRPDLPARSVVTPEDVAALAIDVMTNAGVTGATFEIDGGQQLTDA